MKPSILIVDDDKHTREGLERALRSHYDIRLAENADTALRLLDDATPDLLLTDLRMPGTNGLELLRKTRARHPDLPIILLTAYGSVETAVQAMKEGATDFLTKPVNLDHLELLLQRTLRTRALEAENQHLHQRLDDRYALSAIIGDSPAMRHVFATIRQVASTQATILLRGPSGTGKELVAQAIHHLSPRAQKPFIPVHCAALSTTLLESELFGHEKGAFTGATERRKGRFELADHGTLFLDEISEIDPALQVKLLRVLEERRFERVGGDTPIDTDFRLITATNRNLEDWVAQGKFREDLYFRLNVIDITLPSLKDRNGDIPLLCAHFLKEFTTLHQRPPLTLAPDTLRLLSAYPWPGNVRELRNTIEKMVVLSRGPTLTPQDLPPAILAPSATPAVATPPPLPRGTDTPPATTNNFSAISHQPSAISSTSLADTERAKILSVLEECGNNRSRAAQLLGISRRTLHRKLDAYGIPLKIRVKPRDQPHS